MAGPLSFISTAYAVVRSRLVGRIGRRRARLDAYTPLCDTLIEPSRRASAAAAAAAAAASESFVYMRLLR